MLTVLFSKTFWYCVLGVILLAVIFWACIKFQNGKYFIGTIIAIAFIGVTAYCGVELNFYYSASGGIYGYLTQVTKTNRVEVSDAKFELFDMELKQMYEGNIYGATINTKDVIVFEGGKEYSLFVNNLPTKTIDCAKDYIISEYTYGFYNNKRELILTDTLHLNLSFSTDSTYIEIYTKGGSEAVKYWNYYFNKNKFVVTINENMYISDGTNFSEGELPEYYSVKYMDGEEECLSQLYLPRHSLKNIPNLRKAVNYGQEYFVGWSIDGENVVDTSNYVVNEDTTFKAVYETAGAGLYATQNTGLIATWDELKAQTKVVVDRGQVKSTDKNLQGYLILGERSIAENSFENCALSGISLKHSNVETIASFAFNNCASLTNVELSENTKGIGISAFEGCTNLQQITIPETVTSIGINAFKNCTSLKSIYFPRAVNSFGTTGGNANLSIFAGCKSELVIGCGFGESESFLFTGWNYCDNTNILETHYTYSREGFEAGLRNNFKECTISYSLNNKMVKTESYTAGQNFTPFNLIGAEKWTCGGKDYMIGENGIVDGNMTLEYQFDANTLNASNLTEFYGYIKVFFDLDKTGFVFYDSRNIQYAVIPEGNIFNFVNSESDPGTPYEYAGYIVIKPYIYDPDGIHIGTGGQVKYPSDPIEEGSYLVNLDTFETIRVNKTLKNYMVLSNGRLIYIDDVVGNVHVYDPRTSTDVSNYTIGTWDTLTYNSYSGGTHLKIKVTSKSTSSYLLYDIATNKFELVK